MIFTVDQTCPGPRKCTSFELSEMEREKIPRDKRGQALECDELSDWIKNWKSVGKGPWGYDADGFYWCTYCRRIRRPELVCCPSCGGYFKGPRPNLSIDYECENCE